MNKKQLSARAKKAWVTRKRSAVEVIEIRKFYGV